MLISTVRTVEDLFREGLFEPAKIQRQYSWRAGQAIDLLEDIEEARADTRLDHHYLGPLIVAQAPQRENAWTIYDGFHRIATLTLVFAALAHALDKDHPAQTRLNVLLHADAKARITYPTPGRTLADFIAGRTLHKERLSQGDRNLREVIGAIEGILAKCSVTELEALLDFLCGQTFLTLTFMTDRESAFRAFITANDRGMRLSQGDLLKGYLVDHLDTHSKQGGGQLLADAWTNTQRKLDFRFDDFLRAVHMLKFGEVAKPDYVETWIDHYENETSTEELRELVTVRFPKLADLFTRIPARESRGTASGETLHLLRMNILQWKDWQAPAILIMQAGPSILPDGLRHLAQACWMMEILEFSERERGRVLCEACNQLANGRNPFVDVPLPEGRGYDRGALTINPHNRALVPIKLSAPIKDYLRSASLGRWIETLLWPDGVFPMNVLRNAEVEHVMPRRPRGEWAHLSAAEKEDAIFRIGNLCVIPKTANREIENSGFARKRETYLSLDLVYHSAREVAAFEEWTPDVIAERSKRLVALACTAGLGLPAPTGFESQIAPPLDAASPAVPTSDKHQDGTPA